MVTEKKFTQEDAEIQAGKVHTFISKKIASLKETKKKAFSKKKENPLLGAEDAGSNTTETSNVTGTAKTSVTPGNDVGDFNDEVESILSSENSLIEPPSDEDT